MNREALLHLADVLDQLNPEPGSFDLGVWYHETRTTGCGFKACAIGWGHVRNALPSGLTLDGAEPKLKEGRRGYYVYGWQAVAEAFDIDEEMAAHLFDSDRYDDRQDIKAVVARIREVVANDRAT